MLAFQRKAPARWPGLSLGQGIGGWMGGVQETHTADCKQMLLQDWNSGIRSVTQICRKGSGKKAVPTPAPSPFRQDQPPVAFRLHAYLDRVDPAFEIEPPALDFTAFFAAWRLRVRRLSIAPQERLGITIPAPRVRPVAGFDENQQNRENPLSPHYQRLL